MKKTHGLIIESNIASSPSMEIDSDRNIALMGVKTLYSSKKMRRTFLCKSSNEEDKAGCLVWPRILDKYDNDNPYEIIRIRDAPTSNTLLVC